MADLDHLLKQKEKLEIYYRALENLLAVDTRFMRTVYAGCLSAAGVDLDTIEVEIEQAKKEEYGEAYIRSDMLS